VLENCVSSSSLGYSAYLWVTSSSGSAKDVVVSGNTFVHSDTSLASTRVLDTSAGIYTNRIVFTGNRIRGNASKTLDGIFLAYHTDAAITDNSFENLGYALLATSANGVTFSGNRIIASDYGIKSNDTATSGGNSDWTVVGNSFETAQKAIEIRRNTSGTGPSQRWLVSANTANADIAMYDTVNCAAVGNVIRSPAAEVNPGKTQYAGSTGYLIVANMLDGTALANSTFPAIVSSGSVTTNNSASVFKNVASNATTVIQGNRSAADTGKDIVAVSTPTRTGGYLLSVENNYAERFKIRYDGLINTVGMPTYADNAAATTGGLAVGDLYRTSTGQVMVRY
jgi:hypothetical protein